MGAWWEELRARGLFKDQRPVDTELDKQLFSDGLRHEKVLIETLENESALLKKYGYSEQTETIVNIN